MCRIGKATRRDQVNASWTHPAAIALEFGPGFPFHLVPDPDAILRREVKRAQGNTGGTHL